MPTEGLIDWRTVQQSQRLALPFCSAFCSAKPNVAAAQRCRVPSGRLGVSMHGLSALRWVSFGRHKCKPKLNNLNHSKISQLYADLRKESMAGGMPIAVRLIRLILCVTHSLLGDH